MRFREPLFGRFAIPLDAFLLVLDHAFAIQIDRTQIVLRIGITLRRSLVIPNHRLFDVIRDPVPCRIHDPKVMLGTGMAGRG